MGLNHPQVWKCTAQDCGKLWKEASLRHKEGKGQTFTIIVSAGFPIYEFKFGVFLINTSYITDTNKFLKMILKPRFGKKMK